jgi:hypothetical protein
LTHQTLFKNRRLCNDKIIEATEFWRTCLDFFSNHQLLLFDNHFKNNHENNSNLIRFALMLLSIDTASAQYENNGSNGGYGGGGYGRNNRMNQMPQGQDKP